MKINLPPHVNVKRKKIQDANTYIQNDTYLVKKKKYTHTYVRRKY